MLPNGAVSALHWKATMRSVVFCCVSVAIASVLTAQTPAARPASSGADGEARATRAYQAAVLKGPLALHAFLTDFPKGADLHIHLSGAVYAETFIRDAAEDGLCVDPGALKFVQPPCATPLVPATQLSGNISAANQDLYDRLINAFSMRSYVPTTGFSGHDQFFSTFARFSGLNKRHIGEWVDEVASRAAALSPARSGCASSSAPASSSNASGWRRQSAKSASQTALC